MLPIFLLLKRYLKSLFGDIKINEIYAKNRGPNLGQFWANLGQKQANFYDTIRQ